jgi:hypothetical protein
VICAALAHAVAALADLMTVINLIRASALSARDSRELMHGIRTEIG